MRSFPSTGHEASSGIKRGVGVLTVYVPSSQDVSTVTVPLEVNSSPGVSSLLIVRELGVTVIAKLVKLALKFSAVFSRSAKVVPPFNVIDDPVRLQLLLNVCVT